MRRRHRRWTFGLLLLLAACGRGQVGESATEAAAWSKRLRADAPARDAALVELRRRGEAGVPCVLALLDDPDVARIEDHAAIREELVYILGEAGTTSVEAHKTLVGILSSPDAEVGEALAAARGLVVSWRLCREVPILKAYLALLERATSPDDVRKASRVSALALAGVRIPYEPGFVSVLRAGAERPNSSAFCVGALRRFAGHEAEFVDVYRRVAARLESDPGSGDASSEADRLALRETLAAALAAAGTR